MSTANFLFNKSDVRQMNKNLIEVRRNVNITYIENINTLEPTLKLSKNLPFDSFNYVFLSETNKYYFVSSPPTFNQGYYTITLHEDVLMTLKNQILNCDAIIERNENNFNLYQNDNKMRLYSYDSVRTLEFPNGFDFGAQNFVMGVVGSTLGGSE